MHIYITTRTANERVTVSDGVKRAISNGHDLLPALIVKLVEKGFLRTTDPDDILPENYRAELD